MNYRNLGKTGIKVSPYALGTMMLGAAGNPDHDDAIRIIHRALDAGINFIDTADFYSQGESEQIVGKALQGRRDKVVLTTKAHLPMGEDPNQQGNSRRWLTRALDDSLHRLQTDYIDVYMVHRPSPETDIEETLSALTDLMRAGKIRAIGSSTFPASHIVEAQWVAERRNLARIRVEQPSYSILNRSIEREVLPVCEQFGMGTMVWSPLHMGMLTGRIRKNQPADSKRAGRLPHFYGDEQKLDAVELLVALAQEAGLSLTHLAMAFAIAHPAVTAANLGPRTQTQLEDLLAGANVELSDELLDRIDAIVPPGSNVGPLHAPYQPPALDNPRLRRRRADERSAA
ncbi:MULTISPECIES: aldo/keto reductase [unclassified Halomonas]|uniref:aldo/keto reductase n=1 Tax=unclassified Halomonas TaxID=2609666 RepID=UPI0007D97C9D|nr:MULTISPECIES: aldo/keto reductase [unclassified Halomonas]MBT2785286.1 aldo/keto reductase [Halomonas sp. ISL-106]MBT2799307.1 aldo/keto reductase [Halomonas sp. ISL-104]OAL59567.1 aldo/keto reductase [Halomonas sp. ALS9]